MSTTMVYDFETLKSYIRENAGEGPGPVVVRLQDGLYDLAAAAGLPVSPGDELFYFPGSDKFSIKRVIWTGFGTEPDL